MKNIFLSVAAIALSASMSAQIYMAKNCEITFFSESPLENIEAINKAAKPILNTSTGDIQTKIAMTAFVFEKPLMQEHFNENYAESEKFPSATFKGKINEVIDWTKDGEYKATVTGKLNLHGVEKDRTIEGTITIKGSEITITTKFNIHIADHGIKVPSLYVKNIAEDVEVKLSATLEPYKKK
ncbi:MAG: YceI family protein [Bacteroidota bacterium]